VKGYRDDIERPQAQTTREDRRLSGYCKREILTKFWKVRKVLCAKVDYVISRIGNAQ